jgi:hypothetical protein
MSKESLLSAAAVVIAGVGAGAAGAAGRSSAAGGAVVEGDDAVPMAFCRGFTTISFHTNATANERSTASRSRRWSMTHPFAAGTGS